MSELECGMLCDNGEWCDEPATHRVWNGVSRFVYVCEHHARHAPAPRDPIIDALAKVKTREKGQ